eukprot:1156859-Pelagomonas_calceolata.AAC.7
MGAWSPLASPNDGPVAQAMVPPRKPKRWSHGPSDGPPSQAHASVSPCTKWGTVHLRCLSSL